VSPGFADNNNNKKINPDRPTLDFFLHVNAHIFCVGLIYIFSVVDNFELIVGLGIGIP
jgi:hypothetical protein